MKRIFATDFETTVSENTKDQRETHVWSSALVELHTEDVKILPSIKTTLMFLNSLNEDVILYYHNLKFDGCFWISWLLKNNFKTAFVLEDAETGAGYFKKTKELEDREFKYAISDKGQFYTLTIMYGGHTIEIRDSLKLLPFSLKQCGKAFQTKHQKTEMDYKMVSDLSKMNAEQKTYIENDVLVLKECLEFMFSEGHDKLTIGSCCMTEYKKMLKTEGIEADYDFKYGNPKYHPEIFPDLTQIPVRTQPDMNMDDYIRKAYRGGWCYLVPGKANKLKFAGTTADVNSLYPSMMHSMSGNKFPTGKPFFFDLDAGEKVWACCTKNSKDWFYFIKFTCRFKIKDGYLPFVQIKNDLRYDGTESLETSDVKNPITGEYSEYYNDFDNTNKLSTVTLTMTETDWKLFRKHYNVTDLHIHSVCYFAAERGIFDSYIDKYAKIKQESKGAMRTLAKLFLNNLYGKLATSTDSSFKVAELKEDGSLGFYSVTENNKSAWYIPCGAAITSYARCFTITAAQENYYGPDKPGFIYADTDSIHCDLPPEAIKGITVHNTAFCCWKLESIWDRAIFVRQKTYVEHNIGEDAVIENGKARYDQVEPYYNVKCAGMPESVKQLLIRSWKDQLTGEEKTKYKRYLYDSGMNRKYNVLSDFKIGLELPGKLMPRQVDGGVVLVETTYKMR